MFGGPQQLAVKWEAQMRLKVPTGSDNGSPWVTLRSLGAMPMPFGWSRSSRSGECRTSALINGLQTVNFTGTSFISFKVYDWRLV